MPGVSDIMKVGVKRHFLAAVDAGLIRWQLIRVIGNGHGDHMGAGVT